MLSFRDSADVLPCLRISNGRAAGSVGGIMSGRWEAPAMALSAPWGFCRKMRRRRSTCHVRAPCETGLKRTAQRRLRPPAMTRMGMVWTSIACAYWQHEQWGGPG